tara:strand:+ start:774 stop:1829 length:1056 start_codon:yes stop_codon:yes gene_type:complete
MTFLKIIAVVILAIIVFFFIVGLTLSEKGHQGAKSEYFNGKTFINPSGRFSNGLPEVFKYFTTREAEKWTENYESYVRKEPLPINEAGRLNVTFVNHSTFLIQYEKMTILTDPVWSKRCSPSQIVGPKRMRPPGVNYEAIKEVDIVIISHNHYDHLDENTIKDLINDFDPLFVVPLGMEHIISKWGSNKTINLGWWENTIMDDLKITAVPANHFSSRGAFDRDQTLWTGYVLKYKDHSIYFAGDTGYSDIFKTIGQRIGPVDISFLPIGAYLPRWFMSPIHVSPDEAVKIHQDVRSQQSFAMHFGTFGLADDGPLTPIIDLKKALTKERIDEDKFIVPDEGMNYTFPISDD